MPVQLPGNNRIIERTPVTSSWVVSVGYDPDTSTLEVEYAGSEIYHYYDVPEHVYRQFMVAESKGTFVNQVLRTNGYRYRRLSS